MYDDDGGAPFEKVADTKDGIAVWSRAAPGSNAKEVLAECVFKKTPVASFWRAVCDVERYQEFVPFVKRSFVCKDTRAPRASVRPARFGCTTWSRRRWSDRGTS